MNGAVRVIVCDDSAEIRAGVQAALKLASGIEVVGTAENGVEAVELARRLSPDVVLIDANMPVMDGLKATAQITSERPDAVVIVMSAEGGQAQLRRAIVAGARDFLAKPFGDDELVAAIRRVCRRARPQGDVRQDQTGPRSAAKMVAVYGPRDGIGKTMLAVNLAVAAVDHGRRTALVDLGLPFGEVAMLMGLSPSVTVADLAGRAELPGSEEIEAAMVGHTSGVRVLCGAAGVEGGGLSSELVRSVLSYLRTGYECVVVDACPALDEATLAVLEAADQVLLVVMPEQPLAARAKAVVQALQEKRYPLEKLALVVNRAHTRAGISVDELTDAVGVRVCALIPSDGMSVVGAMNRGVPLVSANPGSRAAQAIRVLARDLFGSPTGEAVGVKTGGRIRGILGHLRAKAG